MENLSKKLYSIISKPIKQLGTTNPDIVMGLIGEKLTFIQYNIINDFLKWVYTNNKKFGFDNYNTLFIEYKKTTE